MGLILLYKLFRWLIKGNKLNTIKFLFIITKNGKVANVKHNAVTTDYPLMDTKFI